MALSDFELEVMQLFWQLEHASAPQIHKILETERDVKYSTVKTIIDRLEKKSAITRIQSQGRTIIYAPLMEKKNVRTPLIKDFIKRVFLGKSRPLVAQIIEQEKLSVDDIEYLENILKARKEEIKK